MDDAAAKALYIKLRVTSLKDEAQLELKRLQDIQLQLKNEEKRRSADLLAEHARKNQLVDVSEFSFDKLIDQSSALSWAMLVILCLAVVFGLNFVFGGHAATPPEISKPTPSSSSSYSAPLDKVTPDFAKRVLQDNSTGTMPWTESVKVIQSWMSQGRLNQVKSSSSLVRSRSAAFQSLDAANVRYENQQSHLLENREHWWFDSNGSVNLYVENVLPRPLSGILVRFALNKQSNDLQSIWLLVEIENPLPAKSVAVVSVPGFDRSFPDYRSLGFAQIEYYW